MERDSPRFIKWRSKEECGGGSESSWEVEAEIGREAEGVVWGSGEEVERDAGEGEEEGGENKTEVREERSEGEAWVEVGVCGIERGEDWFFGRFSSDRFSVSFLFDSGDFISSFEEKKEMLLKAPSRELEREAKKGVLSLPWEDFFFFLPFDFSG
jgi:hypothetical protein